MVIEDRHYELFNTIMEGNMIKYCIDCTVTQNKVIHQLDLGTAVNIVLLTSVS